MTKNIDYIEKQYREHIKEMPVQEFQIYQIMLILNLYDSFIEHDERKALKYKDQIEELTDIYKEKYTNGNKSNTRNGCADHSKSHHIPRRTSVGPVERLVGGTSRRPTADSKQQGKVKKHYCNYHGAKVTI